jgi:hypothetical protein
MLRMVVPRMVYVTEAWSDGGLTWTYRPISAWLVIGIRPWANLPLPLLWLSYSKSNIQPGADQSKDQICLPKKQETMRPGEIRSHLTTPSWGSTCAIGAAPG